MPSTRNYKCAVCNASVCKTQGSIMCSKCNEWIHLTCAKVSPEQLTLYTEKKDCFTCCGCISSDSDECDSSLKDDVRALTKSFNEFVKKNETDRDSHNASMKQIFSDFKNEVSSCIKEMKNDIASFSQRINDIEDTTTKKISMLEVENNILHHRLNRSNIIISGLPAGLVDLPKIVCSLCSFFKIAVSDRDINYVCYINNKRLILAKFNSVSIRDELMRGYFKKKSLNLSDIIGGEICSRVYLNDHFSPAASTLNALCRKLKRNKKIVKYKILNTDKALAKLTLIDGKEVIYNLEKCTELNSSS